MICILQLDEKFSIDNLEEIIRYPSKLSFFAEYVYKDYEIIAKFDESNIQLWDNDFW